MSETLSMAGLFLEGLLSFFSPCILPLVPLLLGYLSADSTETDIRLRRRKTVLSVLLFVLGICTVFFLAALGSSALSRFATGHSLIMKTIGGLLLILFGLFSLGIVRIPALEQEHRFNRPGHRAGSGLEAYLTGFFFSFAWTPCIGPLLGSAIVMAANSSSRILGFAYIGAYCLGFVIMFLLLGLFTEEVLALLKNSRKIVRYTQAIGGAVVMIMGAYMLFQAGRSIQQLSQDTASAPASGAQTSAAADSSAASGTDLENYGTILPDKDGHLVDMRSFSGRTIVVTFFGTWCHYCNEMLPSLQAIADQRPDVQVLLIAAPNLNSEGDADYIAAYMEKAGYTMLVLYDNDYAMTQSYGVSRYGYPTTYFIQPNGMFYGFQPGAISQEQLTADIDKAAGNPVAVE